MSTSKKAPAKKTSFWQRHKHIKHFLIGLGIVVAAIIILIASLAAIAKLRTAHRQNALQPFYNTADLSTSGPLGQVVRSEPLGVSVKNGSALRILYRTQRANGSITFASGMIFIPNNSAAGTPRPVVAWAHGTVGMGDQCAPSRTADPVSNISWVSEMLSRGWVVTATDYAGLGTPGTEGYLVGGDEARDVLNSVRALKYIPSAQAGSTFAVWGHSQGGHSALFTAAQASSYAPDLHLVGTVASAPAAELVALLGEAPDALEWAIGPEVLTSWPTTYPNLNVASITTSNTYNNYKKIANKCIVPAALEGAVRSSLNQQFFKTNLVDSPSWLAAAQAETAPTLSPSQPLMVAESLNDKVVLPNTTALYMKQACRAGSNLTSLWLADVGHIQLANVIAPQVISWIGDRFAGQPATSTCSQPLPIAPATIPTPKSN